MRLRFAPLISPLLSLLVLVSSFAGDPVVINPKKNPSAYAKQLKALKANPSGQVVKFDGINHPGFVLKEVLGQGGATTIFKAVKVGTKEEIALRLPLIRDYSDRTFLFDANIRAAKELQSIQETQQRRLPVLTQAEAVEGFYATTRVLKNYSPFTEFQDHIANGTRDDPKFKRMERDFGQFLREMADVEYIGDMHEGQLVWEDLGDGKGRWTIVDYAKGEESAIRFTKDPSRPSFVDDLFFDFKRRGAVVAQRLKDYKDNIRVVAIMMRQMIPFSGKQNPRSVKPLDSNEPHRPGTGNIVCDPDGEKESSKTGRASRGTLGKAGNSFAFALNVLQFLPEYNPYSEAVGVSCADAKKKLGKLICEWDVPWSPWNNVADCTVVTEVVSLHKSASHGLSMTSEPACGVKYGWVGLRVDNSASRTKLKDAGYFDRGGVDIRTKDGKIPTMESVLNGFKRKMAIDESRTAESLRFPPDERDWGS